MQEPQSLDKNSSIHIRVQPSKYPIYMRIHASTIELHHPEQNSTIHTREPLSTWKRHLPRWFRVIQTRASLFHTKANQSRSERGFYHQRSTLLRVRMFLFSSRCYHPRQRCTIAQDSTTHTYSSAVCIRPLVPSAKLYHLH